MGGRLTWQYMLFFPLIITFPALAIDLTVDNWDVRPGEDFQITWKNAGATNLVGIFYDEIIYNDTGYRRFIDHVKDTTEYTWNVGADLFPNFTYYILILDEFSGTWDRSSELTLLTLNSTDQTSSSSWSSNSDSGGNGLSKGAKTGLAIGVTLGGLTLILILERVFLKPRRRENNKNLTQGEDTTELETEPKPRPYPEMAGQMPAPAPRPGTNELDITPAGASAPYPELVGQMPAPAPRSGTTELDITAVHRPQQQQPYPGLVRGQTPPANSVPWNGGLQMDTTEMRYGYDGESAAGTGSIQVPGTGVYDYGYDHGYNYGHHQQERDDRWWEDDSK